MEDRPRPASAKTVSVLVCPACPTLAAQKREFRRGPREADHLLFDQFRRSDSCRVQNKDRFQAEKLEAALKTWVVLGFLTSFDGMTPSQKYIPLIRMTPSRIGTAKAVSVLVCPAYPTLAAQKQRVEGGAPG